MIITKSTIEFLTQLKKNNSKEWMDENRSTYLERRKEVELFTDALIEQVNKYDVLETKSGSKALYRINRDIRFSKDKTIYKTHFSGYLRRAGAERRGGMYFHIEKGNSFIGGGFWGPNNDDLLLLRRQIEADSEPLMKVINDKSFKKYFGEIFGEELKTAPKGFDVNHPAIELIRKKQFLIQHRFSDDEVLKKDFYKKVVEGFQKMQPFFEVMTMYLTTDLNGESTI